MRYVMIKHYRGGRGMLNDVPMDRWGPGEFDAHVQYMRDFAARYTETGEYVGEQALQPDGEWVRWDGEGEPPAADSPFAETKTLVAGWMIIDVASHERALELAAELSAAPGAGGRPLGEWLELRPAMS